MIIAKSKCITAIILLTNSVDFIVVTQDILVIVSVVLPVCLGADIFLYLYELNSDFGGRKGNTNLTFNTIWLLQCCLLCHFPFFLLHLNRK